MSLAVTQLIGFGVGGPGPATNIFSVTMNSSDNVGGYSFRNVIPASSLTDFAGTQIRFRVAVPPSGTTHISKLYFQFQAAAGDAYDMATGPIQITFSGAGTLDLASGGSATWSDWINFTQGGTQAIVIAMSYGSSTTHARQLGTGLGAYYKFGSDAEVADVSGYSFASGEYFLIDQIEARVG